MDNHQIVETLENIIKDITNAKDALKANNVALKSNATISLADEINNIPDSIKASSELEGFNGGQNTLKGGFIYPNSENVRELNDSNTTVAKADVYEVPEGKYLNLTFPTADIVNDLNSTDVIKFRYNGPMSTIYTTVLNSLYKTYLKHSLQYSYSDTIPQISNHEIKVLLKKENLTEEDGVYKFMEFVFPTFNTNFYVAENDEDKEGKLITKFDIDKFHFSLNYRGKDLNIKCKEMVVDLDFATQIIKKEVSGHDGYHYLTDDPEVLEYYNHREDSDHHIIYLPEFNVEYAGTDYAYNGLSLDANVEMATNVQIRTVDDDINKTLLDDPKHFANILRLVKVYNMDGTKIYNPTTKVFEDASTSEYVTDYALTMGDHNIDKDEYYKNTNNVMTLDSEGLKPINYKKRMAEIEENTKAVMQALTVNKGYVYYMLDDSIPAEMIRYADDNTFTAYYQQFPMTKLLEGALRLSKYSTSRNAINTSSTVNFEFYDEDDKRRANVYPFITNCAFDRSDKVEYNGIRLYTNVDTVKEDGVKYSVLKNAVNTLVSHYDVKLYNQGDLDMLDSSTNGLVENIKTNAAPLVYNENIKSIKIVSDGKKRGVLKTLLGYGMIYQTFDGSRVPEKPAKPMKYILDKGSTIEVSKSKTYHSKVGRYSATVILGPYTTNEMAQYVDKYVHVCVPEDHSGLGKYDFCKFRLPLYNLDETKKYNYSKKKWEPVDALTDDSTPMEDLYYNEIIERDDRLEVFRNMFEFPTEPTASAPIEEYDHL